MMGEEEVRGFEARYDALFRMVRGQYPGFWREFEELAQRRRESRFTTRGARVRDWPSTQDRGVQTWPPDSRTTGIQVRPATREAATQTTGRPIPRQRSVGVQVVPQTREAAAGPAGPPQPNRPGC